MLFYTGFALGVLGSRSKSLNLSQQCLFLYVSNYVIPRNNFSRYLSRIILLPQKTLFFYQNYFLVLYELLRYSRIIRRQSSNIIQLFYKIFLIVMWYCSKAPKSYFHLKSDLRSYLDIKLSKMGIESGPRVCKTKAFTTKPRTSSISIL